MRAVGQVLTTISRALVAIWMLLLVLAVVLVIRIALSPSDTSATVAAVTESVEFESTHGSELRWEVSGFELQRCNVPGGALQSVTLGQHTQISIGTGVTVQITRREDSLETHISLRAPATSTAGGISPCTSAGYVWLDSGDHTQTSLYGANINLTYRSPSVPGSGDFPTTRVFPLRGVVHLGRYPDAGAQEILLSGEVSLHAALEPGLRQWLEKPRARGSLAGLPPTPSYVAETLALQRGDVLPPMLTADNQPSEASGYIRIPPHDALQVGYNVLTPQIRVHRTGNATIVIYLSVWNRLKNEPALLLALGLLGALWGLAQLEPILRKAFQFVFQREQSDYWS